MLPDFRSYTANYVSWPGAPCPFCLAGLRDQNKYVKEHSTPKWVHALSFSAACQVHASFVQAFSNVKYYCTATGNSAVVAPWLACREILPCSNVDDSTSSAGSR